MPLVGGNCAARPTQSAPVGAIEWRKHRGDVVGVDIITLVKRRGESVGVVVAIPSPPRKLRDEGDVVGIGGAIPFESAAKLRFEAPSAMGVAAARRSFVLVRVRAVEERMSASAYMA